MKSGPTMIKWPLLGVVVTWIAVFGWLELARPDPHADMRTTREQEKLDQKIKDCRGSYSQRYDCKSATSAITMCGISIGGRRSSVWSSHRP